MPNSKDTVIEGLDDWSLLASAAAGDRGAYAEIYRRCHPELLRSVQTLLRQHAPQRTNKHLVEDVAADVHLKAFKLVTAPEFNIRDDLTVSIHGWYHTLARYQVYNLLNTVHELPTDPASLTTGGREPVTTAHQWHQRFDWAPLLTALPGAVEELHGPQRDYVRCRLQGLQQQEIAETMGRTVSSVKGLRTRSLSKLSTFLSEQDQTGTTVGEATSSTQRRPTTNLRRTGMADNELNHGWDWDEQDRIAAAHARMHEAQRLYDESLNSGQESELMAYGGLAAGSSWKTPMPDDDGQWEQDRNRVGGSSEGGGGLRCADAVAAAHNAIDTSRDAELAAKTGAWMELESAKTETWLAEQAPWDAQ